LHFEPHAGDLDLRDDDDEDCGGVAYDDNAYLLESLHLLCYLHLAPLLELLLKRDDALLGRPAKTSQLSSLA
jgi:hypothetical protein